MGSDDLVEMAQRRAAAGDFDRAEQYLGLALDSGASEAELTPLLVDVCIRAKRYRDAIRYLEDYLRRHPAQHQARFVLGSLYWGVGSADKAHRELLRVVHDEPRQASARYALAVLLRDEMADPGAADAHFRAYLELQPNGQHAAEARGSLLIQRTAGDG